MVDLLRVDQRAPENTGLVIDMRTGSRQFPHLVRGPTIQQMTRLTLKLNDLFSMRLPPGVRECPSTGQRERVQSAEH